MPKGLLAGIGTLVNLLMISMPLALTAHPIMDYFEQPAIGFYYVLMAMFCFMEAWASFIAANDKLTVASTPDFPYLPYLMGGAILLLFWMSLFFFTLAREPSWFHIAAGVTLITFGIAVRVMAINTLHQYFVSHIAAVNNHRLVDSGIYARVRHPSELGLMAICLGVVVLLESMSGFLLMAFVLLPLTLYRIALEDKLLQKLFAADFLHYKARTPSLLPRLWLG